MSEFQNNDTPPQIPSTKYVCNLYICTTTPHPPSLRYTSNSNHLAVSLFLWLFSLTMNPYAYLCKVTKLNLTKLFQANKHFPNDRMIAQMLSGKNHSTFHTCTKFLRGHVNNVILIFTALLYMGIKMCRNHCFFRITESSSFAAKNEIAINWIQQL